MKIWVTAIFSIFAMISALGAQGTGSNGSVAQQNSAAGQAPQSGVAQPGNHFRVAPGSVIPVQLTKTIDAKKAKPGEEVYAEVTEDLKTSNGQIVVPKNTKITGKVTEAQARNKQQKESELGIAFDHAVSKDGANVALPMSIQAVIAPSYLSGGNHGSNNNGPSTPSNSQASPTPSSGGMSPGARSSGMGAPQSANSGAAAASEGPGPASANPNPHPPITGQTQGVLGIEHLNLSSAPNPAQGSLLTSDKNNVKLEDGTLILLRVNE
jgi:hypothetical protein